MKAILFQVPGEGLRVSHLADNARGESETESAFATRMIAALVPDPAARVVVDAAALPGDGTTPERWAVNWQTGAVSVAPPPPPTVADYDAAIQGWVDAVAHAKGYRDGFAMASYVTSAVFGAEAQAFVDWRDGLWTYAYAQLGAVLAGQRTQPTIDEFLAEIAAAHPAPWPV